MSNWRKDVKQDSRFLYLFDIEGKTPMDVVIEGHESVESFCPGKKQTGMLWCLKFKGAKKELGVNITNGNLIEHALGTDDRDKWVGQKVTLRAAEITEGQHSGDKCIRIHAPGAKLPAQCPRFKYTDAAPEVSK